MKSITSCRVCKSPHLRFALKIHKRGYLICKNCTCLQQQEDIPYQIDFNFEGRVFTLPYYPVLLSLGATDLFTDTSCIFFSLQAIEHLLNLAGYKIDDATILESDLWVHFTPFSSLEKIRRKEEKLRLNSQFSYFLWAVQLKK